MTQASLFNRYSLLAILILFVLPLLYLVKQDVLTSYFDASDKLSIPLWAALYSFFWIVFDREIKKLTRQVTLIQNRIASYKNIGSKEYRTQEKADEEKLSADTIRLSEAKLHFDFINTALRVTVILAALVKIIQLVYTLFQ